MSPDVHGISVGVLVVLGALIFGHGHMVMGWETNAPQHGSSCLDRSLEFITGNARRSIALHEAMNLYSLPSFSPVVFIHVHVQCEALREVLHSYRIISLRKIHAVPTLIAIPSSLIQPFSQPRPL
jgi:hypothetical protein